MDTKRGRLSWFCGVGVGRDDPRGSQGENADIPQELCTETMPGVEEF